MIKDSYAIKIEDDDFKEGSLKQISNARPNRLFTADSNIILYKVGILRVEKLNEIINKTVEILRK